MSGRANAGFSVLGMHAAHMAFETASHLRFGWSERVSLESSGCVVLTGSHSPHLLVVVVVVRQGSIDRCEGALELIGHICGWMISRDDEFVDVEHADSRSGNSRGATERPLRLYDVDHYTLIGRVRITLRHGMRSDSDRFG